MYSWLFVKRELAHFEPTRYCRRSIRKFFDKQEPNYASSVSDPVAAYFSLLHRGSREVPRARKHQSMVLYAHTESRRVCIRCEPVNSGHISCPGCWGRASRPFG